MKTEGSKPSNLYCSIWNSLTEQKKFFLVCEIFLLSACTILEVTIFHILKTTFFLVRVFQMLLNELSALMHSIFVGPPKIMFGTCAFFFGC